MKMPFTVGWEKITPEIAQDWLSKHNTKNRRLRRTTVIGYARDMKIGEWIPNHQGIAFDKDGNLLDGQHRLAAIVMSGVTIPCLIARNVPTKAEGAMAATMDTIDRGAARSVADMLFLNHGATDSLAVTAICALLANIAARDSGRSKKMSTPQALAVMDIWKPHIAFAVENRAKTLGIRSAPVMAAIAFARPVKIKAVEQFYLSLVSGEGLFKNDPCHTLRNYLIDKTSFAKSGGDRLTLVDAILTALHAHIKGEKMSRVSVNQEAVECFRKPQANDIAKVLEIFPQVAEGELTELPEIAGGGRALNEKQKATAR